MGYDGARTWVNYSGENYRRWGELERGMINIGCSWFLADTADLITLGWPQTAYFSSFASLQWIGGCCGGLWAPSCSQHEKLQETCSLCAAHTLTRSQSNIGRVPHIQRLDGINVSGWIIDKVIERCKSNRTTRSHKHTHSESQPAQKFCGRTSLLSLSVLHFPSVCCFFHFCIMVLCFFFFLIPLTVTVCCWFMASSAGEK